MRRIVLALLVASLCAAHKVIPCGTWPLLMQCDSAWGSDPLGSSQTNTICSAGCALTSTSMALAKYNATLQGKPAEPGTVNAYLDKHRGYVDTDLIVWSAVDPLVAGIRFESQLDSMAAHTLRKHIEACEPVIVQVRNGTHFVLAVGYDTTQAHTFYVNDPAFPTDSYDWTGMSQFVTYKLK